MFSHTHMCMRAHTRSNNPMFRRGYQIPLPAVTLFFIFFEDGALAFVFQTHACALLFPVHTLKCTLRHKHTKAQSQKTIKGQFLIHLDASLPGTKTGKFILQQRSINNAIMFAAWFHLHKHHLGNIMLSKLPIERVFHTKPTKLTIILIHRRLSPFSTSLFTLFGHMFTAAFRLGLQFIQIRQAKSIANSLLEELRLHLEGDSVKIKDSNIVFFLHVDECKLARSPTPTLSQICI